MTTSRMFAAAAAAGLLAGSAVANAQAGTPQAGTTAAPATPSGTTAPTTQSGAGTAATTGTAAAPASSGGSVAQGATVYDPQGGTVGTIESVQGDYVTLATAKSKVRLPKSSFAAGAKGPVIAMTAAQVDQAAAQAAPAQGATAGASASAKPSVATGTQVTDPQGGAVGTVAEVDAQYATVQLATGSKVRLPLSAFGAGPNNTLRVSMTAAQISAAANASGGSSSGG